MNAAICVTKRTSCKQNWGEQILSHSSNTPVPPGISLSSLFSSVSSTVLLWASDLWLPAFFLWARLSVSSPKLYQFRLSPFPPLILFYPKWPCLYTSYLFRPKYFFKMQKVIFTFYWRRFGACFIEQSIKHSEIFSSEWHLLNYSTKLFSFYFLCVVLSIISLINVFNDWSKYCSGSNIFWCL